MNTKVQTPIMPTLFAGLYLLVHFIPDLDAADVMGPQWLYTGIIDALGILFIFMHRQHFAAAIQGIFKYKFTLVFSFLVAWASLSYIYAINPTETLVTGARLITTFLVFIVLSILFYKQPLPALLTGISVIMAFVLLYDSLVLLKTFSGNLTTMSLDENILALRGNHGNKNVTAAALLIKFPFVLWLIINSKLLGKILAAFVLVMGVTGLLILNTRSTYVGLLIITIIFIATTLYFKSKQNKKAIFTQIAYLIIPVIIGYFIANMFLGTAVQMQDSQGGYGTVTKRIGDITVASEENSRLRLWKNAIDYSIHHPLIGCGYGNWKLASIPYEIFHTTELFVPYHAHNDFFEMFADLGLLGGLSFALLFLLVPIITFSIWKNKSFNNLHLAATILFMAVTCYAVDAFLNFPAERTAMQSILAIAAALICIPISYQQENVNVRKSLMGVFFSIALIGIIPSIYVHKLTYDSLKIQKFVMGEVNADPVMKTEDVEKLPSIPDMSSSTLPLKAMIARYYIRDKKYDEALALLKESDNVNPYLYYNDFLRTAIYAAKNNFDSALYSGKRAFYNWPNATSYYKNLIFAASKKKDSAEIKKAFNLIVDHFNTPFTWNNYLLGMYEVKGSADASLNNMLDSAIKMFPNDLATFSQTKALFNRNLKDANNKNANDYTTEGLQAFQKGQYIKAASCYASAFKLDPTNYTHAENVGICFYTAQKFADAIDYFKKSIAVGSSTTGKSEYYLGMSYIATGKKLEACNALQLANAKKYPDAAAAITNNCK
ncbi:MAG: O-antigen ligase family protein [Sediminibacterium sp.]|nr:O-antigen ligase family protein [Sediminibacterium sp.]